MTAGPVAAVDPVRTVALLVGVERYRASGWHLDGPALDACRFAEWLLGCGVPAGNITLLASPLAVNEAAVHSVGLPVEPADGRTVRDVLTRRLRTTAAELFFLYWGGHGVVAARRSRRLYFADADETDKRNLDLTSLMESLSSTFFPAHRNQLLVIDACQNLASELRMVHSLPAETYPVGSALPDRNQDVILAASPGELATNLDGRKTGLLSDVLLRQLSSGGWPPRPKLLADGVEEAFVRLRRDGLVNQTPAYVWCGGRAHEWSVALGDRRGAAGAAARMAIGAIGRIVDAMVELGDLTDGVNRQEIISFLPSGIRGAVPYSPKARLHIASLLRTCEQVPGGRQALVDALDLGVSDREGLARLRAVLAAEWPAR